MAGSSLELTPSGSTNWSINRRNAPWRSNFLGTLPRRRLADRPQWVDTGTLRKEDSKTLKIAYPLSRVRLCEPRSPCTGRVRRSKPGFSLGTENSNPFPSRGEPANHRSRSRRSRGYQIRFGGRASAIEKGKPRRASERGFSNGGTDGSNPACSDSESAPEACGL